MSSEEYNDEEEDEEEEEEALLDLLPLLTIDGRDAVEIDVELDRAEA